MIALRLPEHYPTQVSLESIWTSQHFPNTPWILVGDRFFENHWKQEGFPFPKGSLWIEPSENLKNMDTLQQWFDHWIQSGITRETTILAVGGGLVGDMVGLASSLFMRGLPWHFWPTTLVSQADATLGGKTGVNFQSYKNLIGSIHHPKKVLINPRVLQTLPQRMLDAGRWEVIKTALIEGDMTWAMNTTKDLGQREKIESITQTIGRCLQIKAAIVVRDEGDHHHRRILNMGHTLGHALERATGYAMHHGEAVGIGLLAAGILSVGRHPNEHGSRWIKLASSKLKDHVTLLPPWDQLAHQIAHDKKISDVDSLLVIHEALPRWEMPAELDVLPLETWKEVYISALAILRTATHA